MAAAGYAGVATITLVAILVLFLVAEEAQARFLLKQPFSWSASKARIVKSTKQMIYGLVLATLVNVAFAVLAITGYGIVRILKLLGLM